MIMISRDYRVLLLRGLLIFFPALVLLWAFSSPLAHADGGAPNLAYVAGTMQGISIIDIGQQKVTGTFNVGGDPHSVMLSPDGRFLYVAQPALGRVTMLAARTGATICSTNLPGQPALLAFDTTPGANMLYAAGNGDSTVSAIDPSNCAIKHTFQAGSPVYGLAVAQISSGTSSNSDQLWVATTNDVIIFDTSGTQLNTIPIPGGPQYLSIPLGTMAYVTTRQGSVDAIDIGSHKVFPLISGGKYGPMDYDAITGDVYVPDQQHNQLVVLTPLSSGGNPLPPEPNHTYHLGVAPQSVAITSDGQLGFIALSGGNVAMLDVPGKQIVNTLSVGGNPHFIITGLYPPLIGTTPQQASIWGTVVNIVAYFFVIVLFIIPILIFRRYSRVNTSSAKKKQ